MALRPRRSGALALALTGLLAAGLGPVTAQAVGDSDAPRFAAPTLTAAQLAGTPDPGRGWIFGTVVDPSGNPVENARVEAFDYWEEVDGVMSSGLTYGGDFELYRLPGGPDALYMLRVSTGPDSAHPIRTTWVGVDDGIELKRREVLELDPITVRYQKVASRTTAKAVRSTLGNRSRAALTVRVAPGAGSTLVPAGKVTYLVKAGGKTVDAGTATLRNGAVRVRTAKLAGPAKVTCTKAQRKKKRCPVQPQKRDYSVRVSYAGSTQFKASSAAVVRFAVTFRR
ncbi:carboxypeptidase-like regulatory domain-containing protein [Nocardioides ochotonae]|uniref:carboxypeptidase-like regulatory domain-containing protein n=1 Tax=Nocardioides ochotonae TaxID=2685869 RepID=UPI001409AFC6|nr:carboxypeptidase-like regulatory domain-containing protein [Nocardioides ochotonae]